MTQNTLRIVKPSSTAEKVTSSVVDTVEITREFLKSLQPPPFQRPFRLNDKVREVSEKIKRDDGVFPGVLTIGVLNKISYLVDGRHRSEGFLMTDLEKGYADVRTLFCETMGQMADEYVQLNSHIAAMRTREQRER